MLSDHEDLIYKYFPELVRRCDLKQIVKELSFYDSSFRHTITQIKDDGNRLHNNRCILFELLKLQISTWFDEFVQILRRQNLHELANKLEEKPSTRIPHKTSCFKPANDGDEYYSNTINNNHNNGDNDQYEILYRNVIDLKPLRIDVKYSTEWCDDEESTRSECYCTRSKNRGRVLIINNISFPFEKREGAEVDEDNLKVLFERMGFVVESYRDLQSFEMKDVTIEFATKHPGITYDICIFIIMSHGKKIENQTVILGTDNIGVEEDFFIEQFNNKNCPAFKHKPKIMFFHVCRGELVDNLDHYTPQTQYDGARTKGPIISNEDERLYTDMIICHPSIDGHRAHRDTVRGCWYMELVCKVFMENAYKTHVENMLKLVDKNLSRRISETKTRQTSVFQNIGFKTCFLHPGIYEENGELKQFKQSV